jgi:hypothetical protein
MSTVVFPAAVLFGDGLPDVCWMTGQPTRERMVVTFTSSRLPWGCSGPLVLLGVVGVIAFLLLGISANGSLAVSEEVLLRRSEGRRRAWSLAIAGIVVIAAGVVLSVPPIWIIGLLMLAAGPVVARANRRNWLPRAKVYNDGAQRLVRLDGVHPAFVAAATGAPMPTASA